MARRPREVFVSHAHQDVKAAARLVAELNRHRIRAFFSPHSIRGAQQWHDEIGSALERCDWFVELLTPASVKSTWVKRELVYALSDRRYDNCIAPVVLKECEYTKFSWALVPSQTIDFTESFEAGCQRLFASWGVRWKA